MIWSVVLPKEVKAYRKKLENLRKFEIIVTHLFLRSFLVFMIEI